MRSFRGFTLLEAVLAVAILSGAMMAMLGLRAQSLRATQNMVVQQRTERDAQALFDLAIAGMLGGPDRFIAERGESVWRGEIGLSDRRSYTVRRVPEMRENPLRALGGERVSDRVALWRYEVEIGSRTVVFLWHR